MLESEAEPNNNTDQTENEETEILFELGQILWTYGAQTAFIEANQSIIPFLQRHLSGDWGEIHPDDMQANVNAVKRGLRILSSYRLDTNVKFWLITEHDRSVTTFLLSQEY